MTTACPGWEPFGRLVAGVVLHDPFLDDSPPRLGPPTRPERSPPHQVCHDRASPVASKAGDTSASWVAWKVVIVVFRNLGGEIVWNRES